MKRIHILTIALLIGLSSIANDTIEIKNNVGGEKTSETSESGYISIKTTIPDILITANLMIPYAHNGIAESELVVERGEYTIWRIPSNELQEIPSCSAIGNNYKYFVFKNGMFLFTVNECNKKIVYDYFTA
jgi:hypothetical protein